MRGSGSSPCVHPGSGISSHDSEQTEQGVYYASYTQGLWICIGDKNFWRKNEVTPEVRFAEGGSNERRGSTDSEKEFRKKYQAITHRLVHRKSCVEMYRRQSSNSFGKLIQCDISWSCNKHKFSLSFFSFSSHMPPSNTPLIITFSSHTQT